jgi:hypothetical protein
MRGAVWVGAMNVDRRIIDGLSRATADLDESQINDPPTRNESGHILYKTLTTTQTPNQDTNMDEL